MCDRPLMPVAAGVLPIVLAVVAFTGCSGGHSSPGETVERFLAAADRCDTRTIERLLPADQLRHIRQSEIRITALSSLSVKGGYSLVEDLLCSAGGPAGARVVKESVTGNRAEVRAVVAGRTEEIPLVLEEEEWKLDLLGFLGTVGP